MTIAAVVSLVAAALALVFGFAEPFDHSVWLVAYLFLVGFLAQLLLGRGQSALLRSAERQRSAGGPLTAQIILWNAGVIAVPFGVLADTRLAVALGSLSLLAALASLSITVQPELAFEVTSRSWLARGYVVLLAFMTGSVLVGTALAWDIPWV